MSWVPDRAAGGAAPGRRVPAGQRPTWMVVLASLMVVVSFNLFLSGLSVLADGPTRLAGAPVEPGRRRIQRHGGHPAAAAGYGASPSSGSIPADPRATPLSKLVIGALMLFAVAAIATNDRRGRRGDAGGGLGGHPYYVGGRAVLSCCSCAARCSHAAPEWIARAEAAAERVASRRGTPEQVVSGLNQMFVIFPMGLALLGVGFSVVLIAFFGGNRGRAFYGLPPRGAPEAGGGV